VHKKFGGEFIYRILPGAPSLYYLYSLSASDGEQILSKQRTVRRSNRQRIDNSVATSYL